MSPPTSFRLTVGCVKQLLKTAQVRGPPDFIRCASISRRQSPWLSCCSVLMAVSVSWSMLRANPRLNHSLRALYSLVCTSFRWSVERVSSEHGHGEQNHHPSSVRYVNNHTCTVKLMAIPESTLLTLCKSVFLITRKCDAGVATFGIHIGAA